MINISITASCNRTCTYCFARDAMDAPEIQYMSPSTFTTVLDYAQRSGLDEVRLLGGEPTIHPHFSDFFNIAIKRGFNVVLLTGGLIPENVVELLTQTDSDRVALLLNLELNNEAIFAAQKRLMSRLGNNIVLGFNIDRRNPRLHQLLSLIEAYDLQRTIRLGLAHPIWQGSNEHLKAKHYGAVGEAVTRFTLSAAEHGVRISFDCGWVPCMFPEGILEELGYDFRDVGLRCNPIIDVLTDGRILSCYPLMHHETVTLSQFDDIHAARHHLRGVQATDRQATLFPHCNTCDYFEAGNCSGGCLAASLKRRRQPSAERAAKYEVIHAE